MPSGPVKASGCVHRDVSGLAVVKRPGAYTVTHLASGWAIDPRPGGGSFSAHIRLQSAAKRYLLALKDVTDWTVSKDELLAKREAVASKLAEARRRVFGEATP